MWLHGEGLATVNMAKAGKCKAISSEADLKEICISVFSETCFIYLEEIFHPLVSCPGDLTPLRQGKAKPGVDSIQVFHMGNMGHQLLPSWVY